MTELHEYTDDRGGWFWISEDEYPVLSAHIPNQFLDVPEAPFTIWWFGKTFEDKLRYFFSSMIEKLGLDYRGKVLSTIYLDEKKITQLISPPSLRTPESSLPGDARFLRLEYHEDANTSSNLIAWAPIEPRSVTTNKKRLMIGLFAQPFIFADFKWLIARYVQETSYQQFEMEAHLSHLSELLDRVAKPESPAAPLPA